MPSAFAIVQHTKMLQCYHHFNGRFSRWT